jgi:uncharacterized damage-inducible protein DinB
MMPETTSAGNAAAARLRAATQQIVTEARNLAPDLVNWSPGEGVWSIMDNLCHIREFVPYWTGEVTRMVRSPGSNWGRNHADPDRLAAVSDTAANRLDDVLHDIEEAVRRSIATLASLSDADLAIEAESRNPRWGVKPASFVMDNLLVDHLEKHLGQIRRNVKQYQEQETMRHPS